MRKHVWRYGLALAMTALLAAAITGAVSAQSTTEGQQIEYALTGAQPTSSMLLGSAAGSFGYYRIAYPGNGVDLRVRVRFWPYEGGISQHLGFHIYGPDGRVDTGDWQADEGYLEVTYQEHEAANLLVQVFNYGTATASYTITAAGLPEAPADLSSAETLATEATVAEQSASGAESASWESANGVVIGNRGGAYGQHVIEYAGDEKEITVTMHLSPADPSFSSAFGLNVYSPDGDLVAIARPTDDLGVREATWASDVAGPHYLQVYNYSDGVALYYTLRVA